MEARPDLLERGPAAVLYGIMDTVVDDYIPVIQGLDNDIHEVEYQVFSEATRRTRSSGSTSSSAK